MNWQTWGAIGLIAFGFVWPYVQPRLKAWLEANQQGETNVPKENDSALPLAPHVEWVNEIVAAAGAKAPAEFILKHLKAGSTAAQVMADRIKELEGASA